MEYPSCGSFQSFEKSGEFSPDALNESANFCKYSFKMSGLLEIFGRLKYITETRPRFLGLYEES
jgi:hypothetical protein